MTTNFWKIPEIELNLTTINHKIDIKNNTIILFKKNNLKKIEKKFINLIKENYPYIKIIETESKIYFTDETTKKEKDTPYNRLISYLIRKEKLKKYVPESLNIAYILEEEKEFNDTQKEFIKYLNSKEVKTNKKIQKYLSLINIVDTTKSIKKIIKKDNSKTKYILDKNGLIILK